MRDTIQRTVAIGIVSASVAACRVTATADTVAAFQLNTAFDSFESRASDPSVSGVTYSSGPQLSVYGYVGSAYILGFSRSASLGTALTDGNWLEFSFATGSKAVTFDQFYMDNDYIVMPDTFKMGLAYDNGGGTFSETIAGILPGNINSGISLSGFSQAAANETVRFRVAFYDDTRFTPASSLFPVNSTLGGVNNAAVVFTGSLSDAVVPEPGQWATAGTLLCLGAAALRRYRRS